MDVLCSRHRLDERGGVAEGVIDRHRFPPDALATDIDTRERQDFVDESQQVTRAGVDPSELLPLKLCHRPRYPV